MKLLITGVFGFIGGAVARHAAALGHEVIGVGRGGGHAGGHAFRVAHAGDARALCDLVDASAPDVILHAAGSASVGASLASPREDFESAVVTWSSLLDAVRLSNARPLILFPSSAAVYGNPDALPVAEDAPAAPISPYGYHKQMCELLGREYASCFGLDVAAMRLFSVFGPTQRRLLVWELFEQLAGPPPVALLHGTGHESRDFLHADDMADAALRIADRLPRTAGAGQFQVVNVASGEEIEVIEVARAIRDLVAPGKEIGCRGLVRRGDPRRWRADVGRLSSLLAGWRPRPFRERLAGCVGAWQAQR